MKYIYSASQMSKLSLTLHTFSVTGSVAGLFLTPILHSSIHSHIPSSSDWLLLLKYIYPEIRWVYLVSK